MGCDISAVGDLSQDGRAPSSLGINYQGVKTLTNLGNSTPGYEVFEMFAHFYPKSSVMYLGSRSQHRRQRLGLRAVSESGSLILV